MRPVASRRHTVASLIALGAIAFGIAGCQPEAPTPPPVRVAVSVQDHQEDVSVLHPISLKALEGKLSTVRLTNEATGKTVKGELDRNRWASTEPLGYGQTYVISALLKKGEKTVNFSRTFTTIDPENPTVPVLFPVNGSIVGIAQPVAIRFDKPIKNRKTAQECIHITTTPEVEGAFYWISNSELRWRGEHFWTPGTTIDVKMDCYGKDLGDSTYTQDNISTHFTIGEKVVGYADDKTHKLVIKKNGKVIKTMPISMGSAQNPTPNGIYFISEQRREMIMDSSTFGVPTTSPNGYRTPVEWASRMSYSGIFIHAAPWSLGQQGVSNVSHGCLNVSTANGKWVYDNMKAGDPIFVTNTVGDELSGSDGQGDWNIPWSVWKEGNADAL